MQPSPNIAACTTVDAAFRVMLRGGSISFHTRSTYSILAYFSALMTLFTRSITVVAFSMGVFVCFTRLLASRSISTAFSMLLNQREKDCPRPESAYDCDCRCLIASFTKTAIALVMLFSLLESG